MAQLNKVFLIGNLTRDPEVRYTAKGDAVCDMSMATNRSWKTESGEDKEEVCFVTVIVWGKRAEAAGKYLTKGSPVFIEGRLEFSSWEKEGVKRSALKVHAENVQFLSSKEHEEGRKAKQAAEPPDDDIPF